MRIAEILWSHRNDYKALMVCEHCGHEQTDDAGYNDAFYHQRVIPAMHCGWCGLDREGNQKSVPSSTP